MASYSAPVINALPGRRSGSMERSGSGCVELSQKSPEMKPRRIVTRCVAPPKYINPVLGGTTTIRYQVEHVDNDRKVLLETLKESLSTIREALGSTGRETSPGAPSENTQLMLNEDDLASNYTHTPRHHMPQRKISAPRDFSDTISCSTRSTVSESDTSRLGSDASSKKGASGSLYPAGLRKQGELHDAVAVRDWLADKLKATEQENMALNHSKLELSAQIDSLLSEISTLREEMTSERSELMEVAGAHKAELSNSAAQHSALQVELMQTKEAHSALQVELEQTQEALRGQLLENERLAESVTTIEQIQTSLDRTQQELQARSEEVTSLSQTKREMEMALRSYHEHSGTSDGHLLNIVAELEVKVDNLTKALRTKEHQLEAQQTANKGIQCLNESLSHQLLDAECRRIELHSSIRDWRDGVRVFCRLRRCSDGAEQDPEVISVSGNTLNLKQGEAHNFSFDRVFDGDASQATIYSEVSGLVQSALDGYIACIFAYGQTGAGKTFTMQGSSDAESPGLIPRSLAAVFQASEDMRSRGWDWSVQVSIMEVYNENLNDLLDTSGSKAGAHSIVPDCEWGHVVTGMIWIQVSSVLELTSLMDKASKRRAVGITNLNSTSSRSHMVVSLFLKGVNSALGKSTHGALHLVDLAGSERLDKSGVVGDRLKETLNINKSLSSLAGVFAARSQGQTHIPFRNSKLTHMLEPCLSGRGKTLMLVHVKANQSSGAESLCSLRFAKLVSQCDVLAGAKPRSRTSGPISGSTRARSSSPPAMRTRPVNAIRGSRTGRTRSP